MSVPKKDLDASAAFTNFVRAIVLAVVDELGLKASGGSDLVSLAVAAQIASTSIAVVRKAIRKGDLEGFGGQRDRAVKRSDLERWIATRRVRTDGTDSPSIDARVEQLARARAARKRKERAA